MKINYHDNVFISDNIHVIEYDYENTEKYILTENKDTETNHDEPYEVPMMNALRYFPDFVSFLEEDRYKVAPNTTLLYDNDREAWAVGMTGGGMDFTPELIDTFLSLGKGVPRQLLSHLSKNYAGNLAPEKHAENCEKIAHAMQLDAIKSMKSSKHLKADGLSDNENRHITALEKMVRSVMYAPCDKCGGKRDAEAIRCNKCLSDDNYMFESPEKTIKRMRSEI